MKIPVSWLRDFVDVPGSPEEIAATMSVRGFAVEGIEKTDGDDAVLDFEVTANRPDCMSVIGIAREIATAYGQPLRSGAGSRDSGPGTRHSNDGQSQSGTADSEPRVATPDAELDVVIETPALCPRYVGAVADVEVGRSPDWMQARLRAAGVRPISSVVDITNYVLLELGQPMHAFDYARLGGAQIRVRTARSGERLRTLDGEVRELHPDMLVIADATQATAIAGVMGGADSEVTDSTRTIVFESAHFNPLSVRRTSRALGLKTEASMRFERGTDPQLPVVAMDRACALLQQIGAGAARGSSVDAYPGPADPRVVKLRREKIRGLLGVAMPDADVHRILEGLGFSLQDGADGWKVTVPSRRVDVMREVDLIEDVARHYGFDRIPMTFPVLSSPAPPVDPRVTRTRQLRAVMTGAGFSEAVTFGFISKDAARSFAADDDIVNIANPLSETFAVLRPSVLPGLVDAVSHNRRRERRDVRLFEIAARFSRGAGERRSLACVWTGSIGGEHWSERGRDVDFFDIKGVVERACDAMRVTVHADPCHEPWLVPGRAAVLVANGARLGVLGQLSPAVAEKHDLPAGDAVYVAEIDLDVAETAAAREDLKVDPLPRHPSVTRDISVLVDDTLPSATVRETVRGAAPSTLVRVSEFDRYQGKGVPEGKVSLSLRLTFRAGDRTLTDTEVQSAMDAVLASLKEKHGAIQR